jgi:two-component system OmpR family response regulator/two-component system response regulator QseB
VFRRGRPPATEFDLLHALLLRRVVLRSSWSSSYSWGREVDSNAVEVHIHHLRRKLGAAAIRTVRGVGYVMPRDDTAS